MNRLTRRQLLSLAAAMGASLAVGGGPVEAVAAEGPDVRPDAFPQGVASADPTPDGFILWTRRPPGAEAAARLKVEVAEDEGFRRVVATADAELDAAADWTCRVLVAGLRPGTVYWYRFIDDRGYGSRTGRTCTAPALDDPRPTRLAFVSCQNVNMGFSTPYRRMIRDDRQRRPEEQIQFILHLGDFVYEMVWYPEENPNGLQGRPLRDTVRFPTGQRIGSYHVPADVEDYRALYRAYLADPDIQDARARWPFICVWDNHEFSNKGWQSQERYDRSRPAQTRKVAANQAWFEYIPARVARDGAALDRFMAPEVADVPLTGFDENGLAHEPNNLAAIRSLLIARALRWGRDIDLILTDNRSFRSQPAMDRPEAAGFQVKGLPWFASQEVVAALDGGRDYRDGKPPETIRFAGQDVPNPRQAEPPGSLLGAEQKAWFLDRLRHSTATWKLWGNSLGMLQRRTNMQSLPGDLAALWPVEGYAIMGTDDWCGYPAERAEILNHVARAGISNLVSLAGDRHSFFAGVLSPDLPPGPYSPVAVEFVVGSVCTPTPFEAASAVLPRDHPALPLYLHADTSGGPPQPAMNLAVRHGVGSCLELARTGDPAAALAASNPEVAPHLRFADLNGHGFALVRVEGESLEVEFVGMPAPVEDQPADGGPILYRATHRVAAWTPGARPTITPVALEGALPLGAGQVDPG